MDKHYHCSLSLLVVLLLISSLDNVNGRSTAGLEMQNDHKHSVDESLPALALAVEKLDQQKVFKRFSGDLQYHDNDSAPHLIVLCLLGGMLLLVLPVTLGGVLCCKRMGAANQKLDKKLIIDEASPFNSRNNPMDAKAAYHKESLDRKDSCMKTDLLYRSDSFHPLGSPTMSTFGTFSAIDTKVEQQRERRTLNEAASAPSLLEDTPSSLPRTFTDSQPSHVSRLLRESTAPPLTGSTVSLVPGPSLTHHTPPPDTHVTPSQPPPTLTPVYIIPPEVEKVEVRTGRSPNLARKTPPLPARLNSMSSVGSVSSEPLSLSMQFESLEPPQMPVAESDQPNTVYRAVARLKDSEASSKFAARDSVASNTGSVISYVLTRESLPNRHSDARLSSGDETKPLPFRKVPSPLCAKIEGAKRSDSMADIKQRALPPTPDQIQSSPRHLPLTRTSGTLPLKRHRSPLLNTEPFKDESSLDTRESREPSPNSKHRQTLGASWTLPAKKRGCNLVLKSVAQTNPQSVYHRLESPTLTDTPILRPPRPPRKLIDPTRHVDFSHLIHSPKPEASRKSGASVSSDGVKSEACESVGDESNIWSESEDTVCINCGRYIIAEPFYICVMDEEASTKGSASSTPDIPDTAGVINPTNTSREVDAVSTHDTTQPVTVSGPYDRLEKATSPTIPDIATEEAIGISDTQSEEGDPLVNSQPASPMSTTSSTPPTMETQSELQVTTEASSSPESPRTRNMELGSLELDEEVRPKLPSDTTVPDSPQSTRVSLLGLDEEVRPKPTSVIVGPEAGGIQSEGLTLEDELKPGAAICMDCIRKEGPIYHELEPAEIEAILLGRDPSAPPVPPRERPPNKPSPVYERIASVKRKLTLKLSTGSRIVTRVSIDGAYIIEARKPRSLRYRKGSSTDYEQVSTDLETPSSPHYHKASEIHRLGPFPLPAEVDPDKHTRCKPHPPPLAIVRGQQSGSHEYESLPGSLEGRPVNLRGGLKNRRGSHDYAFIGPAPSLESLDERSSSPPFVPPGAHRATLMRIDSQGYASVIIPDHLDEDCLDSTDRDCPFHDSTDELAPPTTNEVVRVSDYEVPVISVPKETITRTSPARLARQRAVSDQEDSHQPTSVLAELTDDVDPPRTLNDSMPKLELCTEAQTEDATMKDKEESRKGSIESIADSRSSELLGNEDVFDSGIENSNEGLEIASPKSTSSSSIPPPRPPRPASLTELQLNRIDLEAEASPPRTRSKTFHIKTSPLKSADKKLKILLNQQSSVVV